MRGSKGGDQVSGNSEAQPKEWKGKESWQRKVVDQQKFDAEYDRIFGKPKKKNAVSGTIHPL